MQLKILFNIEIISYGKKNKLVEFLDKFETSFPYKYSNKIFINKKNDLIEMKAIFDIPNKSKFNDKKELIDIQIQIESLFSKIVIDNDLYKIYLHCKSYEFDDRIRFVPLKKDIFDEKSVSKEMYLNINKLNSIDINCRNDDQMSLFISKKENDFIFDMYISKKYQKKLNVYLEDLQTLKKYDKEHLSALHNFVKSLREGNCIIHNDYFLK